MFHLYHHNDLGRLAELQGALLSRSGAGPLAPETILVPNRGVGRWLQMQLAEHEGVAANLEFPLPAKFFWQLLKPLQTDTAHAHSWERSHLRWHLYALLPEISAEVPAVRHYLAGTPAELQRWQLAEQLADIFDQYMIYRREMLADWEAGRGEDRPPAHWQAPVWRALVARLGEAHRARLLAEFVRRIEAGEPLETAHWPERVYCFGLGNLPPDYLRLLYALGRKIDVHYLLPNPSAEYWGDIQARRVPLATELDALPTDVEDTVADGHPLLASLGRPMRDFLRVLYSDELAAIHEPELGAAMDYRAPGSDSLLHRLQSGIVRMRAEPEDAAIAEDDVSLQINACHGPLREIQVLHDQILDRLSRDPTLQPRDIVVMLPDVASYAPAIHSVFGQDANLPYSISDQPRLSTHPVARSVRELLELPLSRWTASEVMDLAAVPAVMRRLGLDEADLDDLRLWVHEAGVRWGLDAETRREAGAGDWAQNTWRFGLDRLLLGLAQADAESLVDGVAPWSELEGGGTEALGKLWRLVERLSYWQTQLAEPTAPRDWHNRLNAMLDELFRIDPEDMDEMAALQAVHEALAVLETAQECLGDAGELSWEAAREVLAAELDDSGSRQPFLGGGITFCGLVPLRAVPFRMVCVLGMNDGDFPRQDRNRAFNLIRRFPRLGDQSRRDDDRLLFLQALLAARDGFYVSYTGQDVRSGETLEPSPVVGELLDFLQRYAFAGRPRADALARLLVHHPMQPFSSRYFRRDADPRVFTFRGEWLPGTQAQFGERRVAPGFVDDSRAAADDEDIIALADLKRFLEHPSRYFFRERLQLELEERSDSLDDDEPRELDGLSAHALRQDLFRRACANGPLPDQPEALLRAQGVLPPPPLDGPTYRGLADEVNALLPIWQYWHDAEPAPENREVDLSLDDGTRLRGVIADVFPDGLRRVHVGKLKMRRELAAWVDYLVLLAAGQADAELHIAGLDDGQLLLRAAALTPKQARGYLASLTAMYRDGRQRPLTFLPDLAGMYIADTHAHRKAKPSTPADALDRANGYLARSYLPGWEISDPWFSKLVQRPTFLGDDPDTSEFVQLAECVCWPIAEHLVTAPPPDTIAAEDIA